MNRRNFLRWMGAAAAGTGLGAWESLGHFEPAGAGETAGPAARTATGSDSFTSPTATGAGDADTTAAAFRRMEATSRGKLPMRPLGKTGVEVSLLSFGGGWLHDASREEGVALVHACLDRGINYFDTASSYPKSEPVIGEVMKTRRDEAFLATKILKRTYGQAKPEFQESLKKLKTGHVDLLQLHAINSKEELDQVMAPDGALRVALEAQREGQTRFIGITGHTRPEVVSAALDRFPFDTVLIPLGLGDLFVNSFAESMLPRAQEKGVGIIAMKMLGMGRYVEKLGVRRCLRYSLNLPVSTGIVGFTSRKQLSEALEAMEDLRPLSDKELDEAKALVREFANTKTMWWKRE